MDVMLWAVGDCVGQSSRTCRVAILGFIPYYTKVVLPVVLSVCEIQCLTLGEVHKSRVFKNGVLWRIFGPQSEEVEGNLHS